MRELRTGDHKINLRLLVESIGPYKSIEKHNGQIPAKVTMCSTAKSLNKSRDVPTHYKE